MSKGPGKHPAPPANLNDRVLPIVSFHDTLWRIYLNRYPTPLFFGKSISHRFDAPDGAFGVCYCAMDIPGAFVETFGHATGSNLVTFTALSARSLVEVDVENPLRLVDLTGPGLKKIGADNGLTAGGDYTVSRAWSEALYNHPETIDGILYRARNDPDRLSIVVFERCASSLRVKYEVELSSR